MTTLSANGVEPNGAPRRVIASGRPVNLTSRQFELRELPMRHRGQVLTTTQIIRHIWSSECVTSNVVDVAVAALRRKVGEGFIESVRGVGYRFSGVPVTHTSTSEQRAMTRGVRNSSPNRREDDVRHRGSAVIRQRHP